MAKIKAYLINLDRAGDRLAHMRGEFERIGLAFNRVSAVDGSLLDADVLDDFARNRIGVYPRRWKVGEIGCFLSHFDVWRQIASGGDEFAAVLEDDVHLAADLKNLLDTDQWIPADADLVRLEANQEMRLVERRRIDTVPGRSVFRAASHTWGSAGYIVSRRAAGRLTRTDPEFHCWLDVFLFHPEYSPIAAALRTYQVVPAVCVQDQVKDDSPTALSSSIRADGRTPPGGSATLLNHVLGMLPWNKRPVTFRP